MGRILLTGSRGFVGGHLAARLQHDGHALSFANRSTLDGPLPCSDVQSFAVGDIGPDTDWRLALADCKTVIHLAGQTTAAGPHDDVCERVNTKGTARLVRQAADAGVTTFVFLSSVMALVDNWSPSIVTDGTPSIATSPYGTSKLRAEQHVAAFTHNGHRGISLRPPMIYGAGAKGNWRRLQNLAATGLPLPFASVTNRRSLISVRNLVDAIATVVRAGPAGPSGTFIVDDGTPLSLADIIRHLREGMRRPARLVPLPPVLLRTPLHLSGLASIANSLLGDLAVDGRPFRTAYDWAPIEQADDAIRAAGAQRDPGRA